MAKWMVLFLSTASIAGAQVPLFDGFGGAAGYGSNSNCLGPNDDGSSMTIDLSSIFPAGLRFFDRTHTVMFVNTNGNITFSNALPQYTPDAFPVADQPMIAPFWADVDIRYVGSECMGSDGGGGFAGSCHAPSSNGVWWHLDTAGQRVIITWDEVEYFGADCSMDSKIMSFQLILTPAAIGACGSTGDFDVEFRFNRCEWNTGDASGGTGGLSSGAMMTQTVPCILGLCPLDPGASCSGGSCTATTSSTPAQSGFDAGNSTDFVEIMGSRTGDIHTILCTTSNVDEPGIWRFQIRSGVVLCPDAGDACDTGMMGVCGSGLTQCVGGGRVCRQEVDSGSERCDDLDNDCDGMTDEGDLCAAGEVCTRGRCIGSCFEGGCPAGLACSADGRCVDEACTDVTCPTGEICRLGTCVGACDGVSCPAGLSCRNGSCVDLCDGAECDDCTACRDGICIAACSAGTCGSGRECGPDGLCIDAGCSTVTCGVGDTCVDGACVDACVGARCPFGDICQQGRCVPEGTPPPPDGGTTGDGGTTADGGTGSDSGTGPGARDDGCGCSSGTSGSAWPILAAMALLYRRRRSWNDH